MNTKFTIKNFRVFDENGVSIDIKPLTILTGCNSSGKSSIVKAAFLLYSFMNQVNNAIEKGEKIQLSKYKLDFTKYPNNLLGRFDKVIPDSSSSNEVTLCYTIHSCLISKDVDVEFVFSVDKNDVLNNAYLVSIKMSTDDGVLYSSNKKSGTSVNLNLIKEHLPVYAITDFLVNDFCSLNAASCLEPEEGGISEDEYKTEGDKILSNLREIGRSRVMDVVNYIRLRRMKFQKYKDEKESNYSTKQLELLDNVQKNNTYFNIPVLDYLHSIKKENVKSIIESEMIPNSNSNTYLVSPSIILSASDKIVTDFLNSDFDTFDEYFKDAEYRFFENASTPETKEIGIPDINLKQDYLQNHPGSGWGWDHIVLRSWDNEDCDFEETTEVKTKEQRIKEWEDKPVSFEMLYQVVMVWNEKYVPGNSNFYKGGYFTFPVMGGEAEFPGEFHHYAFDMLTRFFDMVIFEVLSSSGIENMSYVSSSRATVKKLYSLDEKNDFTELLRRYFDAKRLFEERDSFNKPHYNANDFMNYWIKQFGLGDSLSLHLDDEGLGIKIRLHKEAGDKGRLLSDEGYGITQLISILLQIETAILSSKEEKANHNNYLSAFDKYDTNVYHFEVNTIAIEEPEIHLHPSYQSKLAEMFAEAYSKYNIHFIIETHSEYLIRKMQTLAAKKVVNADDISIQYVYHPNAEKRPLYTPQIISIKVKSDGRLTDSFGSGFFDEADNAAMELLTLKELNL